jgi:hypothetical protein
VGFADDGAAGEEDDGHGRPDETFAHRQSGYYDARAMVVLAPSRKTTEGGSVLFDVFRRARVVFRNPRYLGPALLVLIGVAMLSVAVARPALSPRPSGIALLRDTTSRSVTGLLVGAVTAWPLATLLALAIGLARGEAASFKSCWTSLGTCAQFLVVGWVFAVACGIGVVLLIIPGVMMAIVWSQVQPLVVDRRSAWLGAFAESQVLTRGSRGDIFAVGLAVTVAIGIYLGFTFLLARAVGWSTVSPAFQFAFPFALVPIQMLAVAVHASLYLELLHVNEPLTSAEFSFASPLTR